MWRAVLVITAMIAALARILFAHIDPFRPP